MARYKKKLDDDIRCPLEYGLAIFGGKWKSRIICVLSANGKLRYSEFIAILQNTASNPIHQSVKYCVRNLCRASARLQISSLSFAPC